MYLSKRSCSEVEVGISSVRSRVLAPAAPKSAGRGRVPAQFLVFLDQILSHRLVRCAERIDVRFLRTLPARPITSLRQPPSQGWIARRSMGLVSMRFVHLAPGTHPGSLTCCPTPKDSTCVSRASRSTTQPSALASFVVRSLSFLFRSPSFHSYAFPTSNPWSRSAACASMLRFWLEAQTMANRIMPRGLSRLPGREGVCSPPGRPKEIQGDREEAIRTKKGNKPPWIGTGPNENVPSRNGSMKQETEHTLANNVPTIRKASRVFRSIGGNGKADAKTALF